jgi:hypothetical protein
VTQPEATEPEVVSRVTVDRVETEPGIFILQVTPTYSLKSVAKIIDVESVATVNRYVKDGSLKSFWTKAGKRVNHNDLVEFLQSFYTAPKPRGNIHKVNEAREARRLLEIQEEEEGA